MIIFYSFLFLFHSFFPFPVFYFSGPTVDIIIFFLSFFLSSSIHNKSTPLPSSLSPSLVSPSPPPPPTPPPRTERPCITSRNTCNLAEMTVMYWKIIRCHLNHRGGGGMRSGGTHFFLLFTILLFIVYYTHFFLIFFLT